MVVRCAAQRTTDSCLVDKIASSIVHVECIRFHAIVAHVDIDIAVPVKVSRRNSARRPGTIGSKAPVDGLYPVGGKTRSLVIRHTDVMEIFDPPNLVAANVQVNEAVVVMVTPRCAARLPWALALNRHGRKAGSRVVAIENSTAVIERI